MSFVVLDTDAASVSLRGKLSPALRSRLAGESLCVTFVTLGELTKWTVLRDWGPRRMADLASWRRQVVLLPFDEQVAIKWGEIQARAQLRGRPRPVNYSWIAACCLAWDLPLATFNRKDFDDFAEHDGLRLIDAGHRQARSCASTGMSRLRLPARYRSSISVSDWLARHEPNFERITAGMGRQRPGSAATVRDRTPDDHRPERSSGIHPCPAMSDPSM